ncbi:hypothetical protein GCM10027160_34840 [Streptomyces calidiresistens]|uniref:Protein kinase domain-containing protein n=1 Tax=Streptomyces calidiresistens TaxID=1485586 RepID=A0A7W3SZI0_9ACTN|nr:hypothetical protein [Streptomyces calidiresistens]MBB0228091.1 hypothetical protein [Streptomyces calidiresistens]
MAVSRDDRPVTGTNRIRKFPTGANYAEVLQHPELCFRDPDLRHGTVQQSAVLGPKAISGNFASVFSITARDGQRYALKCFTRDTSAIGTRYTVISTALRALDTGSLSQPWPVRFEFLEQGVLVLGDWFPVLRMAWVRGTDLISWIDRHHHDPTAVHTLADRFLAMTGDLEDNGIAHGDLQHGNILVAEDGTLRLVDYDGMYVPALKGEVATENGHRNYQSPQRGAADFGPAMDRFSTWLIHLSLLAVATDPSLWNQLHEPQGEYLILSESDLRSPATSLAWPLLLGHSDQRLRTAAARVQGFLGQPCSTLPRLTADTLTSPTSRHKRKAGTTTPTTTGTTRGATDPATPHFGTLPAWMVDRMASATAAAVPTPPALAPTGFTGRRPRDLTAAAAALLSTAAPGVLSVTTGQPEGYLPAAQGAALLASAAVIGIGRRLRPEYRTAHQRIRELRRRARELKDPAGAHQRLEQEMQKLDDATAKEGAVADKRIRTLQTDLRVGLARITMELNRRTDQPHKRKAELSAREQNMIAAALEPAVRRHVEAKLRATSIQEARSLPNMGAKTVGALMRAGIRTAADFTGVSYSQSQGTGNRVAYFIHAGGHYIRVPGVGEARASALDAWRRSLEQRARTSAPAKLPGPALARIRAEIATLRARYDREIKQAESKAQQDRDVLQKRITDERQRLTADRQQRAMETQRKRADLLQRQKQLSGAEAERARMTGALSTARTETRRNLGVRKYLTFLLTGH